ncbi:MAG: DUF488 domain-containing protein [Xanthobacteraceae bacterium]|jgi:uncharacterized protein (DUF488 family)
MTRFDLFSIGHSNIPAERFIAMLQSAGVDTIVDVRSTPVSRFCPWFSAKNLAPLLSGKGMNYSARGDALGGRPRDAELYRDGIADYEAMARQPEFEAGLQRVVADAARCRGKGAVCLMCSEREPLDCHRCLLVARALARRGLAVGHIHHDGAIEPHAATEQRLLALDGNDDDLFVTRLAERLAAAYRRRAHAIAYRAKSGRSGTSAKAES